MFVVAWRVAGWVCGDGLSYWIIVGHAILRDNFHSRLGLRSFKSSAFLPGHHYCLSCTGLRVWKACTEVSGSVPVVRCNAFGVRWVVACARGSRQVQSSSRCNWRCQWLDVCIRLRRSARQAIGVRCRSDTHACPSTKYLAPVLVWLKSLHVI